MAADLKTEQGCLLSDVRLPGISGLELLKKLKSEGVKLPVILISGYTDSDLVAEAFESGVVAVLEKPIDPSSLAEHIEKAIGMSQQN